MNSDPKNNKNLDWLKSDLSPEFKQKVFNAAFVELEKNKVPTPKVSFGFNMNWAWSSAAALALVSIMVIRLSGVMDLNSPTTTFDDLALLTPEEIEVVENLDVIEGIENIDLDQIRKEMKKRGKDT